MWVAAMECSMYPQEVHAVENSTFTHSLKLSIKRHTTMQMKHQIKFHFLIGSVAQLNRERYITRLSKIQRLAHHGLYVKMLV